MAQDSLLSTHVNWNASQNTLLDEMGEAAQMTIAAPPSVSSKPWHQEETIVT